MEKKIKEVVEDFDFEKVRIAMQALNWKWALRDGLRVPDIRDMKETAIRLLADAYKTQGTHSTGGFVAEYWQRELWLRFEVEMNHSGK